MPPTRGPGWPAASARLHRCHSAYWSLNNTERRVPGGRSAVPEQESVPSTRTSREAHLTWTLSGKFLPPAIVSIWYDPLSLTGLNKGALD
eukprot:761575-Hanusia_phi.AAC.1